MYVIIPLQLASTRVPEKNIRPFFNGKSLFDIKAEQILTVIDPGSVYVSSEDDRVKALCEQYGFCYLKRDRSLTGNTVKQPDLIRGILQDMPQDDQDIMWVQVTQPLFDSFQVMLDRWRTVRADHDSIAAVRHVRKHILSDKGIPVNFNYGYWHKVTQELPVYYELLWSCYILTREAIQKTGYHLGVRPFFLPFDDLPLVDIDTEDDFRLAAAIYGYLTEPT